MKNIFLYAVIFLTHLATCYAQDTIVLKSGDIIQTKVKQVNATEVIYKKYDYLEGPVYAVLKSAIVEIRYENGSKDIFKDEQENGTTPVIRTETNEMYLKGQKDATRYYNGYTGAGTGTLVTSLLSPLVGLIPAIACASSQPKDKNLQYPDPGLMKNKEYNLGYNQRARKIKKNKVWTNWGIAFGVNLVAVLLLSVDE